MILALHSEWAKVDSLAQIVVMAEVMTISTHLNFPN